MKTLLIIPPFTQPNTTYPSVVQLSGFLRKNDLDVLPLDLSVKTINRIFSKTGLAEIFNSVNRERCNEADRRTMSLSGVYTETVETVTRFLRGENQNMAYSIINDHFLPKGEAFERTEQENTWFGEYSVNDRAKYLCSMYISDLIGFINRNVSNDFGFSRYAESLGIGLRDFSVVKKRMETETLIDKIIINTAREYIQKEKPGLVCFSVPFPGNLLSSLLISRMIKNEFPEIKIAMGGGYVNTELRKMSDKRIFDYVDFLTFDDGEIPLLNLIEHLRKNTGIYTRTMFLEKGQIVYRDNSEIKNIHHNELPAPDYTGINPGEYMSLIENVNPMHRLWSDGFWNKITLAHGCYWAKCTFCDGSLDYIKRFEPGKAAAVVDKIESIIKQTGRTSFHFTDEAAPPSLLKEIALEILRRGVKINWWGNIRFENKFSEGLCRLLALSGCIAVSGGIEAAGNRLLKLINKAVTVEDAARVCNNFRKAGIMVHSYLMYGFPTQTEAEIIDSLEIVKQFFRNDLIQSAYWHRFSLTCHSNIALQPDQYGIIIKDREDNSFANNDLNFTHNSGIDYGKYSFGLKKALFNYMHKNAVDWPLNKWFDFKVPFTSVAKNYITKSLEDKSGIQKGTPLWIAADPEFFNDKNQVKITINTTDSVCEIETDKFVAAWIKELSKQKPGLLSFDDLQKFTNASKNPDAVNSFLKTEEWKEITEVAIIFI